MGASKRIMEDLIFSYSDNFPVKTARFANVAFSNGSLPDGFLSRMKKLQPLGAPSDVRRYFVSPIESGQICMLSCMLGGNREIFFPKLEEAQMMRFDEIAEKLLTENGYEVIKCSSDEEAIEKAKDLQNGSKKYPVHFSGSETSGEKAYEEFFTDEENVDMARLKALGIITGKALTDRKAVQKLIEDLTDIFENENATKDKVVSRISDYLPNFNHIETGKSLDNKL